MPMPDAERWRTDLAEIELRLYAGAIINCHETLEIACDPKQPEWYAKNNARYAGTYAKHAANIAHSILRHSRELEDELHDSRGF